MGWWGAFGGVWSAGVVAGDFWTAMEVFGTIFRKNGTQYINVMYFGTVHRIHRSYVHIRKDNLSRDHSRAFRDEIRRI